jgi:hypothetical protein
LALKNGGESAIVQVVTRELATHATRRLVRVAVGALAISSASSRASAGPAGVPVGADFPIGLDWERGPGAEACVGDDALRRAVEGLLQRRVFAPVDQTAVLIRGRVAPTASHHYLARLTLVVGDGSLVGERTLESDTTDCASLSKPLSLVIALAVDSLRALPKSTLRLDEPKKRWSGEVALAASYERWLLPEPAFGFGVDAILQPPSFWPLEMGVLAWPFPTFARDPLGPGVEVKAIAGRAGLCPWLVRGASVGLRLCLGVQGGRFLANGVSVDVSRSPSNWMVGGAARMAFWVALGRRFALESSAGAFIPFIRYRFTYTDESGQEQPLYREPPVALLLELAIPLQIP